VGPAASFAYERPDFPDAMALFSRQR
jgi:hypothetical protein